MLILYLFFQSHRVSGASSEGMEKVKGVWSSRGPEIIEKICIVKFKKDPKGGPWGDWVGLIATALGCHLARHHFLYLLDARPAGQKFAKFGALGLSRATGPWGRGRPPLPYARVNGTASRGPLR